MVSDNWNDLFLILNCILAKLSSRIDVRVRIGHDSLAISETGIHSFIDKNVVNWAFSLNGHLTAVAVAALSRQVAVHRDVSSLFRYCSA